MNDTFTAWASFEKDKPLIQTELNLRTWDEDCVDLDITHCGICASDIHTIDDGWGPSARPAVVGHEIVGVVTRVGKNVKKLKVGDRAGVGAQCDACHKCDNCTTGHENICENGFIGTFGYKWSTTGENTYGGYADKWRGDHRFAFKVPDNMSSENAACFYCAGLTTFAPLNKNNVNKKSVVGVMGIGGLGHLGIMFAKAMGATVIGISHNEKKREVAKELGCDGYIDSSNESDMAKYKKKLTHILCTGNGRDFKWGLYFNLLRVDGHFMNVNAPEWNFPEFHPLELCFHQVYISGSLVGSPADMEAMLKFAVEKNIKPWISKYKMSDVNKAIEDFRAGKPKFRFVLEN